MGKGLEWGELSSGSRTHIEPDPVSCGGICNASAPTERLGGGDKNPQKLEDQEHPTGTTKRLRLKQSER